MKRLYAAAFSIGALLAFSNEAEAYCIRGTINYVNDWEPLGLGPRLSGAPNTTRPLRGLQVIWTRTSGGAQASTYTDSLGRYQVCQASGITSGTWQLTLRWGDKDQRFRLVSSYNALTTVAIAPPGVPNVVITNSNKVQDYTIPASPAFHTDLANAYDAVYEWFDTMGVKYGLATGPLASRWAGMGTIQIVHSATNARAQSNAIFVPISTPTLAETYFHELGHVMQINMQQQASGCDFFSCSWSDSPNLGPSCIYPPTGRPHDSGSEALVEGWADFIAKIVSANGNPPTGVGSTSIVCQVCEIHPIKGDPFLVPECGTGSLPRARTRVAAALGDLVDNESTVSSCATENVTLTVNQVAQVMVNSFHEGFAEGESGESNPDAGPTPGVGNSDLKNDGLSLLDFLYFTEAAYGVRTRRIWGNSCWQPGDAIGPLTND